MFSSFKNDGNSSANKNWQQSSSSEKSNGSQARLSRYEQFYGPDTCMKQTIPKKDDEFGTEGPSPSKKMKKS